MPVAAGIDPENNPIAEFTIIDEPIGDEVIRPDFAQLLLCGRFSAYSPYGILSYNNVQ